MPPPPSQVVEVVVWRASGDGTATPEALQKVEMRLDREDALPQFLGDIRERTGAAVALLRMTEEVAHVELLEGGKESFQWREPDVEIGGQSPWNKLGWWEATTQLISASLKDSVGATVTAPLVQIKHWSISALLRVETDRGTFWFKQVPPFMAHEARLVRWLAALRPGVVPEVVAHGADWMLSSAFASPETEGESDNPYATLASLQQAAAPRASELLALGCPDRRPPSLLPELRALAERSDLIDADTREKLTAAYADISMCIDQLDDAIPASVVHGDLHGGNWTRNADGSWLIFDWTDGCLAHPFMDLGVLDGIGDDARPAACRDTYLEAWRVDAATLKRTVLAAAPVAAAFHALSYQNIADNVALEDRAMWVKVARWYLRKMFELLAGREA